MFQGFNIENLHFDNDFDYFYNKGRSLYDEMSTTIQEKLSFLEDEDCILDADKIQSDWFPNIKADVFLSHSHADEKLAIAFAGWLNENFGLRSFIDSCLWGYCDKLLRTIDHNFCENIDGKTYNYKSRNASTSVVHMILMNALTKMMDKTECLMFLNTPNSIVFKNSITSKTYSPWIFGEIETSRYIRKIIPDRLDKKIKDSEKFFSAINESQLKVAFPANTSHLISLNCNDLEEWLKKYYLHKKYYPSKEGFPLNYLYRMKNIIN